MAYVLLIATVGTSPEPICKQILQCRPRRLIFVCTEDTKPQAKTALELAKADGFTLAVGTDSYVSVDDHQDVESTVRAIMRDARPICKEWIDHGPDYEIVVDFTGGTKPMSVGLALATMHWSVGWRYVGGKERNPEQRGIVRSGSEQVIDVANPSESLGLTLIQQSCLLFDRGDFAAASQLIKAGDLTRHSETLKKTLTCFGNLFEAFDLWDRFQHKDATERFISFEKSKSNLISLFGEKQVDLISKDVLHAKERVTFLGTLHHGDKTGPSLGLLQDIFHNGLRREEAGRLDDALGRFYRCVEALAQLALRERYDVLTSSVERQRIDPSLLERWGESSEGEPLQLALRRSYELLASLGDGLGHRFLESILATAGTPLTSRNNSILAHGFQPIKSDSVAKIRKALLTLEPALSEGAMPRLELLPKLSVIRS